MLTEEQLKIRKTGIGGSDAPICAGMSPWRSPLDLYLDKIGESDSDFEGNDRTYFGNVLEPIIRDEYARRTGNGVIVTEETFRHKKYPWMIANVDGLIKGDNAILECKTASAFVAKKWGIPGTDEIPDYYLIQCAHYASVCNVDRVDIAVLIDNSDFRIYHYQRNEDLEKNLISIERDFWENHVEKCIPPAPLSKDDYDKFFKEVVKDKCSSADEDIINAATDLHIIKEKIKSLEEQKKRFESKIKSFMGSSDTLVNEYTGEKIATWKEMVTNRIDTNAIKKDNPDLIEQYKITRKSRVFRVTGG